MIFIKCPNCGAHIPFYNLKPNCHNCGVNIMYFTQEKDLVKDAKRAELEFASARIVIAKVRETFIGGALSITRLVMLVAIIAMLLPPFASACFTMPYYMAEFNVSGLGIYNAYSNGLLQKIPDFLNSLLFGEAMKDMIILYGIFLAVVVLGVAIFAFYIFSFLNIKKTAKIMAALSYIAAVLSLATGILSIVFNSFDFSECIKIEIGFGGFLSFAVFAANGIINHKIAKKEINLKLRENDILRKETLKKVKAGEINLDDLTLPVYETEEEKKERIEALERLLLEEEGSNE